MQRVERFERAAVERVLAFANLGKVKDPEAVYEILDGPLPSRRFLEITDDNNLVPLFMQRLAESGSDAARILRPDMEAVEAMLQALLDNSRKARAVYGQRVSDLLGKGVLVGNPRFERGRVQVELRYASSGVEAACGYGLALLYDVSKPYGAALARCRPGFCDKWFLRLAREHGGRSPAYHDAQCQRDADKLAAVERARAWRADRKESSR